MKNNCLQITSGAAFLTAALLGFNATADTVVYDNTAPSSYLNQFFRPTTPDGSQNIEFGDEINLASGNARTITEFKFEYFANLALDSQGNDFVRLRLYSNGSGVGAPPTTLLYDSITDAPGGIPIFNGINNVDVAGMSLNVPGKLTWTATFDINGTSDIAGLNLYSPVTIGGILAGGEIGSRDDMWQNVNGTWTLFRFPNGTPAANFAARVTAVPEPSSVALGVLGGLVILARQVSKRRVQR